MTDYLGPPTKVRLVCHTHPSMPAWAIIEEDVPLGTEYALLGCVSGMLLRNRQHGDLVVDCYLVERDGVSGYLPAFCFETRES